VDGHFGYQLAGMIQLSGPGFHFHASTQRSFGDFRDIASVTANPNCGVSLPPCSAAPLDARDQVVLSVPIGDRGAALSLSYTRVQFAVDDLSRLVGVSLTKRIASDGSLFATAFADLEDGRGLGAFVGFTIPLGQNHQTSVSATESSSGLAVTATLAGSARDGGMRWQVRDTEGADPNRSATFGFGSPVGGIAFGVTQGDGGFRAFAQVDGAIVLTRAGFFLAPRIDDAFAVVDVGFGGVPVFHENRLVGDTNSRGRLLVTGLRSYQGNTIAIDPTNLPVDATVGWTNVTVVPEDRAGVVVRFEVEAGTGTAIVTLRDELGALVAIGSIGRLNDLSDSVIIGYDGMAYLTRLAAQNRLVVQQPGGSSCVAEFPFIPMPGMQAQIQLVCRAP
jgi:outer membrane usher protein